MRRLRRGVWAASPAIYGAVAGVSYHATSTTYFAAMSVQPDATRKGLIDTLIAGLDTDGVLTKLQALWLIGSHDAQAARVNAKTPGTFDLTAVSSPTFTTDRGYETDGTSYLDTSYIPNTSATQDDHALGAWVNQTPDDTGSNTIASMGGNSSASHASIIIPRSAANLMRGRVNASSSSGDFTGTTVADKKGLTILDRSASALTEASRNGDAVLGNRTSASTGRSTFPYFILGNNNAGTLSSSLGSTGRVSAAFVGASLGATHRIALYNRLNTYLTAIGAN